MKASFVAIATTSLACLWALAAQAAPTDGFHYEIHPLTDHVTMIVRPDPVRVPAEGNVTVIEQEGGLVVVDAGGSPTGGRRIVEKIKQISSKPVRYLIYTHYHGDHNLGAGSFLKAWPQVTIISTEKTRENMSGQPMDYIKTYDKAYDGYVDVIKSALADPAVTGTERTRFQDLREDLPLIEKAYHNMKAYPADLTFSDRLDIADAKAPVQVLFLGRANTDGDAVVWLPSQRVVVSGDIVVEPIPYASASFPGEWISVLQKIKTYDFAYLIPGHGAVQADHTYLDKLIGLLQAIQAFVAPFALKHTSMDDVYKAFRESPLREQIRQDFAGDDTWNWRWMRSVCLTALIANAYKEAKNQPITQGHDGG